jgi:hypothetical protein
MRPYNAKSGAVQYKPSKREVMRGAREGNIGFCLACGQIANCVEPDARKYTCQCCGAPKVYGAEELILMNLFYKDTKK